MGKKFSNYEFDDYDDDYRDRDRRKRQDIEKRRSRDNKWDTYDDYDPRYGYK